MKIIDVLKQRTYFLIALAGTVFMLLFYPFVQTIFVAQNIDLWFQALPPLNLFLFLAFSGLFGGFLSFQIFMLSSPKVCPIKKKGTAGGALGTAFGFLIGVCPSCVGFAGLFFPVAITAALVVFSPLLFLVSIGMILLAIRLNGGFKK